MVGPHVPVSVLAVSGHAVSFDEPRMKHRMLKTDLAGVSTCLKQTKCRSCWRLMPAGEKRFGIYTFRPVGKEKQLQKYIQKFVCLPCAKDDMVELFKEIRAFRRKINRTYRADRSYYVALELGGDGAEKRIVKKRADKEWRRRNNLRRKLEVEVVQKNPELLKVDAKKIVRRIVTGPAKFIGRNEK